ncbi:NADPH-dependent oxidoreductase [Candidatus Marinamargulisbacteria bacterium SCGC AAA071-K20]|nr:NADPH-dependent oxidoreductase [Candidatus Marinamargulisbacteria bacterium SCGC AAA071-K20]
MKNITIIIASKNKNLELAHAFESALTAANVPVRLLNLVDTDMPLYTPKTDKEHGVPQSILDEAALLKKTNGFVVIAPEYNGGIPPVLTNFLAWVSRSSEDWRDCFNGKPAVIATHSGGGGINVLVSMRTQLAYLGVNVIGRQIHTNFSKALSQDSLDAVVSQLITS